MYRGKIMDLKRVPVFGSILFLSSCLAEATTNTVTQQADPVYQSCQEFGESPEVCACVSRESHTRFSHQELTLMAHLGEDTLTERLETSDLSSTEQTALIHRVRNADIVIRQTCGAGLVSDHLISGMN